MSDGYTDSGDQQPVGCRCSPDIEAVDCARLHPAIHRYEPPETHDSQAEGLVDPAYDTCQECGRCLYVTRHSLICQGCMEPYGECECEPLDEVTT